VLRSQHIHRNIQVCLHHAPCRRKRPAGRPQSQEGSVDRKKGPVKIFKPVSWQNGQSTDFVVFPNLPDEVAKGFVDVDALLGRSLNKFAAKVLREVSPL
jgi:hypothetical protein